VRLKLRPEDFSVRESWRFDEVPGGGYLVYAMDKQKLTTFQAIERIAAKLGLPRSAVSFCGLKDKQGRTEQLIAIKGEEISFQEPELKLRLVGETDHPLSAKNTTSNRFGVTVRDLEPGEVDRIPESLAEVNRLGVINYFDSQRFGHIKHGQGFIAKDLLKGQWEHALHNLIAQPSDLDASEDAKLKGFWKEHWGAWRSHGPKPDARTFHILRVLRERPTDFKSAFMTIEPRYRALILFTYQSYLWNEGVKLWLLELFPRKSLIQIPYQVGALLFPREAPAVLARVLRDGSFPLLGPDSVEHLPAGSGPAEAARRAVETTLRREKLTLPGLRIPDAPLFFKHEERPLTVVPGKLVAAPAERDEYFPGKWRVRLSFTLPSGSYATLVVRRLFWFSEAREREASAAGEPAPTPTPTAAPTRRPPAPSVEPVPQPPKGFLARQRERKAARRTAQERSAGKSRAGKRGAGRKAVGKPKTR
jgi:tRNA pseudouridine13 synthase